VVFGNTLNEHIDDFRKIRLAILDPLLVQWHRAFRLTLLLETLKRWRALCCLHEVRSRQIS